MGPGAGDADVDVDGACAWEVVVGAGEVDVEVVLGRWERRAWMRAVR